MARLGTVRELYAEIYAEPPYRERPADAVRNRLYDMLEATQRLAQLPAGRDRTGPEGHQEQAVGVAADRQIV